MPVKDAGYYGYAFFGTRALTAIALVPVIGLVSNFISLITKTQHGPPQELTGTLVIACMAFIWCALSATGYDDSHIPFMATCGLDLAFLVPFIVLAGVLGGPLSVTTCSDISTDTMSILVPLGQGSSISYLNFVGSGRTVCYELQAVWGLTIALAILFLSSAVSALFLFLGRRKQEAALAGPRAPTSAPGGAPKFDEEYGSDLDVESMKHGLGIGTAHSYDEEDKYGAPELQFGPGVPMPPVYAGQPRSLSRTLA